MTEKDEMDYIRKINSLEYERDVFKQECKRYEALLDDSERRWKMSFDPYHPWIDATKELPPKQTPVIVYYKNSGKMEIREFDVYYETDDNGDEYPVDGWFIPEEEDRVELEEVSFWMPRPSKPEEQK